MSGGKLARNGLNLAPFHSFKADLGALWSRDLAGGRCGWSLRVSGKNELVGRLQAAVRESALPPSSPPTPCMPLGKCLWLQEAQYA